VFAGNAQGEALLARLQRIVEDQSREGHRSAGAAQEVAEARAASRGAGYLAFEDLHRGTRDEIKRRQSVYIPHFQLSVSDQTPLLDLGCGRGEFLDLCREAGLPARGVDVNPAMVAFCRERGLDVTEADGLTYLRALPKGRLGGILLSQVIEHLSLDQLTELVALCAETLAPGGVLIAETVNPQSLSTFAGAFYVDLTHHKPVHPEAARFLWRWAGLGEVQIIYLSPLAPEQQLESLPGGPGAADVAGAFNRNVVRLNQLVFGPLDYAVVGRK
jgi:O-antigen chain-terminating methyltransferase